MQRAASILAVSRSKPTKVSSQFRTRTLGFCFGIGCAGIASRRCMSLGIEALPREYPTVTPERPGWQTGLAGGSRGWQLRAEDLEQVDFGAELRAQAAEEAHDPPDVEELAGDAHDGVLTEELHHAVVELRHHAAVARELFVAGEPR